VEFSDGLAGADRILPEIPPAYDGIFDLCVCHPVSLVAKLLASRPRYFVKHVSHEAAPHYWLYFYRDMFSYMETKNADYLDAFEAISKAHIALSVGNDSTSPISRR